MKPELVSFRLCPFVQRSIIVLREKSIAAAITYIELDQPPAWFTAISPFGKVPLLRVGDTVLFESAVIMEYLDEVTPPSLHPADPLRKAHHRAWFEFASNLFALQYRLTHAREAAEFDGHAAQLRRELERLEREVRGPYFGGADFHLVDAAFAPFFTRAVLLEQWHPLGLLRGLTQIAAWQETLLARPAVRDSVVADFAARLRAAIARGGGAAAARFS